MSASGAAPGRPGAQVVPGILRHCHWQCQRHWSRGVHTGNTVPHNLHSPHWHLRRRPVDFTAATATAAATAIRREVPDHRAPTNSPSPPPLLLKQKRWKSTAKVKVKEKRKTKNENRQNKKSDSPAVTKKKKGRPTAQKSRGEKNAKNIGESHRHQKEKNWRPTAQKSRGKKHAKIQRKGQKIGVSHRHQKEKKGGPLRKNPEREKKNTQKIRGKKKPRAAGAATPQNNGRGRGSTTRGSHRHGTMRALHRGYTTAGEKRKMEGKRKQVLSQVQIVQCEG